MKRTGVFVCWCGSNIAGAVDVDQVVAAIKDYPGVAHAEHYVYMCSEPGQKLIRDAIRDKKLDSVVIASCSPTLHETTFRGLCRSTGLNPYQCEMANIREQCSWVHKDNKEEATLKAIRIVKTIVEKVNQNESLEPIKTPVTRRAMVIGGGIAGIQASLDIANAGYEVILVERSPSIGGHMIQLSETFPTLDCSQCILTPKMVEVARHPKIKLMAYSEIQEISGYVGNFKVKIKQKPRYIDCIKCTGCGICTEKCPVKVSSEFNEGLANRKAIYIPFPQAIPNYPVIDRQNCLYFKTGKCKVCEKFCSANAIKFDDKDKIVEEEVGAVVVATGYDIYPIEKIGEYGAGKYKDVINGLQFERLLSASGPTAGEVKRLSDGKVPKRVVFISCVGSRDPEHHLAYCSKICCMYMTKHAMLYKHKVHDGEAIIFYIDTRAGGKGYEEFVSRAQENDKIVYIRGKVSKVFKNSNDKLVVWGADTLIGKQVEVECDMVVLSMAMVPSERTKELLGKLKIGSDPYGFVSEVHPKMRPVESVSAGFFIAGASQAPKDVPETVAQASAAASKVTDLFAFAELAHEPIVASVDEEICSGCGICIPLCPYKAREIEIKDGKRIAKVQEILCEGCGNCVSGCPANASQQHNLTTRQLLKMVKAGVKK
ncbi:MAG: CoB--CoM heterodisulfide reductase iron-sulfur subunit A family protein [Candidatus Stahlbacteria bacterium]|nr:CoB--CoM heterodisulfide reductase iron-sulfur subunit A family protein [Candidatus Stahlbacteria bacterium]